MSLNKNIINKFINVTSLAAIATYKYIGKKNKIAADKAAVDVMRSEINKLNIAAKIVIGEGELDDAPMLYTGEKLGTGNGPSLDIAVDPVEGTRRANNTCFREFCSTAFKLSPQGCIDENPKLQCP